MIENVDEAVELINGVTGKLRTLASNLCESDEGEAGALFHCVGTASDLAEAISLAGRCDLRAPVYVLSRSLVESLVWSCWVTKSAENARRHLNSTNEQIRRILLRTLKSGTGKIRQRETSEDVTEAFLLRVEGAHHKGRPTVRAAAAQVALGRIYDMYYGFFSMHAHLSSAGLAREEAEVLNILIADIAFLRCHQVVVSRWEEARQSTSGAHLRELLAV